MAFVRTKEPYDFADVDIEFAITPRGLFVTSNLLDHTREKWDGPPEPTSLDVDDPLRAMAIKLKDPLHAMAIKVNDRFRAMTSCALDKDKDFFARDIRGYLLVENHAENASREVDGLGNIWALATDGEGDAIVGSTLGPYWSHDAGKTWQLVQSPEQATAPAGFVLPALAQGISSPLIVRAGPPVGPPLLSSLHEPLGGSNSPRAVPSEFHLSPKPSERSAVA